MRHQKRRQGPQSSEFWNLNPDLENQIPVLESLERFGSIFQSLVSGLLGFGKCQRFLLRFPIVRFQISSAPGQTDPADSSARGNLPAGAGGPAPDLGRGPCRSKRKPVPVRRGPDRRLTPVFIAGFPEPCRTPGGLTKLSGHTGVLGNEISRFWPVLVWTYLGTDPEPIRRAPDQTGRKPLCLLPLFRPPILELRTPGPRSEGTSGAVQGEGWLPPAPAEVKIGFLRRNPRLTLDSSASIRGLPWIPPAQADLNLGFLGSFFRKPWLPTFGCPFFAGVYGHGCWQRSAGSFQ